MVKNLEEIVKSVESKGYSIDRRPFALNIVGIRNSSPTDQDTFDDQIAYFYYDNAGLLKGRIAPATTDPSTYYLENPTKDSAYIGGTAILKSGQYKNAYIIGLHRNKYEALVQRGAPVSVIRDNDRNSFINYFAPTTTGYYGINIHRATRGKNNAALIDKDSAGCQVFRDEADFNQMMSLARTHRTKYGNQFTYTLIDERDTLKMANTIGLGVVIALVGYYLYTKSK